jgi:hypothetical protein
MIIRNAAVDHFTSTEIFASRTVLPHRSYCVARKLPNVAGLSTSGTDSRPALTRPERTAGSTQLGEALDAEECLQVGIHAFHHLALHIDDRTAEIGEGHDLRAPVGGIRYDLDEFLGFAAGHELPHQ